MGFDIGMRHRIAWAEGTAYAGFEVVLTVPSIGEVFELDRINAEFVADLDGQTRQERAEALWRRRAEIVAAHLIEWNAEVAGRPVPATLDGVMSLSGGLINSIVIGWLGAATQVAPPLPVGSHNGASFPEESIPMTAPL